MAKNQGKKRKLATLQMYEELVTAYDHFNGDLFLPVFGKDLPGCILTLQRKHNTAGYFTRNRFTLRDPDDPQQEYADEIALNPTYFPVQTLQETMRTMCHEMVHQHQYEYGTPGRGRYHNAELADMMECVGIVLSDTGRPGGKRTGDQMSDYSMPDGPFEQSCQRLLTKKFALSWLDRFPVSIENFAHTMHMLPEETKIALTEEEVKDLGIKIVEQTQRKKSTFRYTCPLCAINVWGKAGMGIGCLACNAQMDQSTEE